MILLCMICVVGKPQNASANTGNIYAFICTGSGADDATVKNDAKEIREVLLKNKVKNNVSIKTFVTNQKSTKSTMNKKISEAYKNCTVDDVAVFCYTGHGYSDGKGLAVNKKIAYSYKELAKKLDKVSCERMIVIINACYSGSFYEYGLKSVKSSNRDKYILFLSSRSDETSEYFKQEGYSRYIHTLTAGLGRAGKVYADKDENGSVTAEELSEYINIQMKLQLIKGKYSKINWGDVHPIFYASNKKYPIFKYTLQPSVKLDKSVGTIYTSGLKTMQLKAIVKGTKGKITWSSKNKNIAVVDSKGMVTAKNAGTTIVTAKVGNVSAQCRVTVKKPSIKLDKKKLTIYTNGTNSVVLNAIIVGASKKVSWKSSNEEIAIVDAKGKVTAKKTGEAIITASANGCKASCTVIVKTKIDDLYFNKMPAPEVEFLGDGLQYIQVNIKIDYLSDYIKKYGKNISLILSDGNIAIMEQYEIENGVGELKESIYVLTESDGHYAWFGRGYYKISSASVKNGNILSWELLIPKKSFEMKDLKYISIETYNSNRMANTYTYKCDFGKKGAEFIGNQDIKTFGVAVPTKMYPRYLD